MKLITIADYDDAEESDDDEEAFIPVDLCNIDFDEDIEGLSALFNSYKNKNSQFFFQTKNYSPLCILLLIFMLIR